MDMKALLPALATLVLALSPVAQASGQDSAKADLSLSGLIYFGDQAPRRPEFPLFEEYPLIRDYRLNQGIQGALRWGAVGALGGAVLGSYLMDDGDIGLGALVSAMLGGPLGLAGGVTAGTVQGFRWETRKSVDPDFHAPRHRFGYEVDLGNDFHADGRSSMELKGLALSYRRPVSAGWVDEIQLARSQREWFGGNEEDGYLTAGEDRYGLRYRTYFRDGLVNPFLGVGAGYAKGEVHLFQPYWNADPNRPYWAVYMETFTGVELNVFDLFHAKAQLGYEPLGSYGKIRRHGALSYLSNFDLRFSLGAQVF